MVEPGEGVRQFDVHGLRFSVEGDWDEVVEAICRDYAWYAAAHPQAPPHVRVSVRHGLPDFDAFQSVPAAQVTEHHVVYRVGGRTVIDHLGVVASVIDGPGGSLQVEGIDPHVARRIGFDFLLARIGDYLDALQRPRIYGLGLAGASGGVLVILPRGGGKTTLALRALREAEIRFFSEVSPLIDRRGQIHPFPFPLWVRGNSPEAELLPDEHVRRMAGEKTNPRLLELEAFHARIARDPEPLRHIVLGVRSLGRESNLERLDRSDAVAPLLRQSVVTFSLADAIRFGARRSRPGKRVAEPEASPRAPPLPPPSPFGRIETRARCCLAGLRRASVWRLTLGRDREANWAALAQLFR